METKFCAFSGHRAIPEEAVEPLRRLLREKIASLAAEGVCGFLCGGAMGFDTLAAEMVLEARSRFPEITLTLALPYPGQADRWPEAAQWQYQKICDAADEVIYVSEAYTRFCMMQRNRYLVDHASVLVCYLMKTSGGTAGTVKYALHRGLTVENLAMEIE